MSFVLSHTRSLLSRRMWCGIGLAVVWLLTWPVTSQAQVVGSLDEPVTSPSAPSFEGGEVMPNASHTSYVCDVQTYFGVQHCYDAEDDIHLLIIDLADPHIRFETVLSSQNGVECNSVNHVGKDPTSNCGYGTPPKYPFETLDQMLGRYTNKQAVAAINTDYYGRSDGDHGAQGLAVKNGVRLDGPDHGSDNINAVSLPSLALSPNNVATIGVPGNLAVIKQNLKTTYFNTVGGWPLLVTGGQVIGNPCSTIPGGYENICADKLRSAAGLADDQRLILVTAKKTAVEMGQYLVDTFRVNTALSFDGGGSSSMVWIDHTGQIQTYFPTERRALAESLMVFSEKMECPDAVQGKAVDVALIVDSSGSMGTNDPQDLRKRAAKVFVQSMSIADQIAIIDFDSMARVAWPLQPRGCDPTSVLDAINTIDSSGNTNIGAGLALAYEALDNSGYDQREKVAILLTDGQGGYSDQAQLFQARGWRVYTLGLGAGVDENLLQRIAQTTGGEYQFLTDAQQLVDVYFRINTEISGGTLLRRILQFLLPQALERFLLNVPAGQSLLNILTSWPGSTVDTTLTTPDGRTITPEIAAQDPNVSHFKGTTFELYQLISPPGGNWTVEIFGADLPSSGEEVAVQAAVRGLEGTFSTYLQAPTTIACDVPQWRAESWVINDTNVDFINGEVSINLPSGLALAATQPATQTIALVAPGNQQFVAWNLVAAQTTVTQTLSYSTTVQFSQGITTPLTATANVLIPACIQTPAALTLVASQFVLVPDGTSTLPLTVTVQSADGQPLVDIEVSFTTTLGTITSPVLTDVNGMAQAVLTAGTVPGDAVVTARVGELSEQIVIELALPTGLSPEPQPNSGSSPALFLPMMMP